MSVSIDLKVAQLLCSRLCHDLIGPVGAVNAGIELIGETGPGAEVPGDALALVGDSARQLNRRLAFFRVAFGLGASADGTMALAEVRKLAAELLDGGRVALDWSPEEGGEVPAAAARLVLNMVLLGAGALPRGGGLGVRIADLPEGTGVAMTATGPGARLREDVAAAMAPDVSLDELSAQNIHGYLAARLAGAFGIVVEVSDRAGDEVRLAALVPGPRG